jgi:diphthamide synthase subunit DPH2
MTLQIELMTGCSRKEVIDELTLVYKWMKNPGEGFLALLEMTN